MAQNIKNKRLNSSHSQAQSLKAIIIDDLYDVLCAWVWVYVGIWLSIWLCVCTYDWVYDSHCAYVWVYGTHSVCVRVRVHVWAWVCMYVWFSNCVTWGSWEKHDFLAASPWQAASLGFSVLHAWWSNKINVVRSFGLSTHSPQWSVPGCRVPGKCPLQPAEICSMLSDDRRTCTAGLLAVSWWTDNFFKIILRINIPYLWWLIQYRHAHSSTGTLRTMSLESNWNLELWLESKSVCVFLLRRLFQN